MKKTIRTLRTFSIALLAIMATENSMAQDNIEPKATISLETDPSTFAFKGYAIHFRIKPKECKHILLGAGTYALDMPSIMVDMNGENKNKGWEVRINSAYSFFGEYYFKEANQKWFVGLQAGVQNFKNKNEKLPNQNNKYSNMLLMPSIGYNWQPFKFPMYIKPWMGIGYTTKITGENNIGSMKYDIAPILPFATVHLGYTF